MSFYVTYPSTSVSSGPIQFYLDGTPTYVSEDTGTPANSVPLPVVLLDGGGIPVGFNTNYGASSGAVRAASQIGNATGAADFNAGVTGAQTLRVEANQGAASATPWPVTGPLTDTQLRAAPVDVAVTGTVPLPTGAATAANQTSGAQKSQLTDSAGLAATLKLLGTQLALGDNGLVTNTIVHGLNSTTGLGYVDAKVTPAGELNVSITDISSVDGQKTMALSFPVAIANDQSAIPITAASLPLPTGAATAALQTQISAQIPTTLGQKTSANSMAVVIASDQSAIPVSPAAGASGDSPGSTTVSTVATITAPANAIGFILMNLDTSTTNMRYRIGATAATNSGQQLQPGRDTGFVPCGANISIIAETGTVNYDIQWIIK